MLPSNGRNMVPVNFRHSFTNLFRLARHHPCLLRERPAFHQRHHVTYYGHATQCFCALPYTDLMVDPRRSIRPWLTNKRIFMPTPLHGHAIRFGIPIRSPSPRGKASRSSSNVSTGSLFSFNLPPRGSVLSRYASRRQHLLPFLSYRSQLSGQPRAVRVSPL